MPIDDYKRIIALLPEATLIVSGSGMLLAVNGPALKLLDLNKGQVAGSLLDLVEEVLREETLAYLQRCARSKQALVGAFRLATNAGIQALTAKGAVLDPRTEGREASVLLRLFTRDEANARFQSLKDQIDQLNMEVARRRRAEYEHREQTRWLEVTLSSIGDAVITVDAQNRVSFMNPVAEVMTGWTQDEALGESLERVFVIVNEYTGEPVPNPSERALRERTIVELANHTVLIDKAGGRVAIEDTAAPIILEDEIRGAILVFHDVSDRRVLERQLMERAEHLELANRRKNEFLAMLAHELRSPLAPISNAVEIMRMQSDQLLTFAGPQKVIARQVQHLKRLVDDMLDVSRITRGKMNIVHEDSDFAALAGLSCSDFRAQFERAGIRFDVAIPANAIAIQADPDRITQVLHNLLSNALKFTPTGGAVSVSVAVEGQFAVLHVADTGSGIEEAELPDLFDPFTQAAQTLDRSTGGLGLGLSLVKGIVGLHGGRVSARSEGAGKGSTFTVWLPLAERATQTAPASATGSGKSPGSSETAHRVLLIEDEKDTAATMQQLLDLLGHEVHLAHTGPEGLKKAMAIAPTLIICDIGLPGLDGFAVAQRLRQSATTESTPLVALTGYGDGDVIQRARDAGFDHHVTKPASLEDIRQLLTVKRRR
ncbi:response regulator [Proteobacteria bacterium 005FR1]|nr:response regulator [Proteobacteria bacterium 005FR1]